MFKIFIHLARIKAIIVSILRGERLRGIFIACILVFFSAALFFAIMWACLYLQTTLPWPFHREKFFGVQSGTMQKLTQTHQKGRIAKLIFDTDGGVDDAIAIFMLLSERLRPVNVLAITTVSGYTDVETATKNILRTIKVLERDPQIPIYMGTTLGILKYPGQGDDREYYFGYEGYGETGYQGPSLEDLPKYHAVLAIIDAVKKYPGEVTIFCTGPLTNIALAIRIYPEFVRDVRDLYLLGGSIYALDDMDFKNEFNFIQDPEAVKIVFDHRIGLKSKIFFVTWEKVTDMALSMDWRVNILGKQNSRKIRLLNMAEQKAIKSRARNSPWIVPSAVMAAIYIKSLYEPYKRCLDIGESRRAKCESRRTTHDFSLIVDFTVPEFKNMLTRFLS